MHAQQGGASCNCLLASVLPALQAHSGWGQMVPSGPITTAVSQGWGYQALTSVFAVAGCRPHRGAGAQFLGRKPQQVGHNLRGIRNQGCLVTFTSKGGHVLPAAVPYNWALGTPLWDGTALRACCSVAQMCESAVGGICLLGGCILSVCCSGTGAAGRLCRRPWGNLG